MNYLTEKENEFFNALKEDYKTLGDKSFLKTLFLLASFDDSPEFAESFPYYNNLDELKALNPVKYKILSQVQWLFESSNSKFIGKYKDHFIGTGTEGEYFSIGKEIQNIPYNIIYNYFSDPINEIEEVIENFHDEFGLHYLDHIAKYKEFCKNYGLIYIEGYDYHRIQHIEFEEYIKNYDISK